MRVCVCIRLRFCCIWYIVSNGHWTSSTVRLFYRFPYTIVYGWLRAQSVIQCKLYKMQNTQSSSISAWVHILSEMKYTTWCNVSKPFTDLRRINGFRCTLSAQRSFFVFCFVCDLDWFKSHQFVQLNNSIVNYLMEICCIVLNKLVFCLTR